MSTVKLEECPRQQMARPTQIRIRTRPQNGRVVIQLNHCRSSIENHQFQLCSAEYFNNILST